MSQYLPTGNFRWVTDKEISKIDLGKFKTDGKKGLILEVEYPRELHDTHNDYPVAPEKVKVSKSMLSRYCKKIAEKYKISIGQVNKLIPTLKSKEKYVLHYRNLQLYLDLGLNLTKVHRVLEFGQSPWLKVQMKCFFLFAEFERVAKIRKIAVYRFLISLLVPEL